jgi:hypothetical protein
MVRGEWGEIVVKFARSMRVCKIVANSPRNRKSRRADRTRRELILSLSLAWCHLVAHPVDYAKAELLFQRALDIVERTLPSNDPALAMLLTNLAQCDLMQGPRHAQ